MHDMAAHLDGRGPFSGLQRLGRLSWRVVAARRSTVTRTPDGGTATGLAAALSEHRMGAQYPSLVR